MNIANLFARFLKTRLRSNKPPHSPLKKTRHRLFFALCPEASTREELVAALALFPRQLSNDWVAPANLHISLAVLGGVELEWLDDLKAAADAVQAVDFELSLDRITYWPHKQALCLTPSVVPPALKRLAADLAGHLDAVGFDMGTRPYRPYLTLARRSTYPSPEIRLPHPIAWHVTSFALLKSRPEGLGTAHDLLQSWPLLQPPEAAPEEE